MRKSEGRRAVAGLRRRGSSSGQVGGGEGLRFARRVVGGVVVDGTGFGVGLDGPSIEDWHVRRLSSGVLRFGGDFLMSGCVRESSMASRRALVGALALADSGAFCLGVTWLSSSSPSSATMAAFLARSVLSERTLLAREGVGTFGLSWWRAPRPRGCGLCRWIDRPLILRTSVCLSCWPRAAGLVSSRNTWRRSSISAISPSESEDEL